MGRDAPAKAARPAGRLRHRGPAGSARDPALAAICHFDVPDMTQVLEEAWEPREEELLDADDFRDFTFANAVRLHAGMNPRFFEGTAVESEAAAVLASDARASLSR